MRLRFRRNTGVLVSTVSWMMRLHVACAIAARADLFVTTDDALLRKLRAFPKLAVGSPGEALAKTEGEYED